MIKMITRFYFKFPPLARNAINVSLNGIFSCAGVEYYNPVPEQILLGCDEMINKTLCI